jgi:hypothetical protein
MNMLPWYHLILTQKQLRIRGAMINLIETCIVFKQVYRETPFMMMWISYETPKNELSRSMDFMHKTAICNFLLPLGIVFLLVGVVVEFRSRTDTSGFKFSG